MPCLCRCFPPWSTDIADTPIIQKFDIRNSREHVCPQQCKPFVSPMRAIAWERERVGHKAAVSLRTSTFLAPCRTNIDCGIYGKVDHTVYYDCLIYVLKHQSKCCFIGPITASPFNPFFTMEVNLCKQKLGNCHCKYPAVSTRDVIFGCYQSISGTS